MTKSDDTIPFESVYSPVPKPGDIFYSDLVKVYILVLGKPTLAPLNSGYCLHAECLTLLDPAFPANNSTTGEKTFSLSKCGWKFLFGLENDG